MNPVGQKDSFEPATCQIKRAVKYFSLLWERLIAILRTNTGTEITAAIFAAFLKCPTKAYLIAHGETAADAFIADMRRCIGAAYKSKAGQ
jgi:hypothetical protein